MSTQNERESEGIGIVTTTDAAGKARQFIAAILGDGWVGISDGTWGAMGIIQIVPLREQQTVEYEPPPMSLAAERLAAMGDGNGIMLCFRKREDVVSMIQSLTAVLKQMPATEAS
mgnify:FL=1